MLQCLLKTYAHETIISHKNGNFARANGKTAAANEANRFERRIIIITTLAQSASFLLHLPASHSTENDENEFNDGRVSTKKIFAQAFDVKIGMDFCA